MVSGESAVEAHLPSQKIGIAVAVTCQPEAFDGTTGAYHNVADQLWRQTGSSCHRPTPADEVIGHINGRLDADVPRGVPHPGPVRHPPGCCRSVSGRLVSRVAGPDLGRWRRGRR